MTVQEGTATKQRHTQVTITNPQPVAAEKNLKEIFVRAKTGRAINLCPVRDILVRISDKWSLLTILLLGANGTLRFNEIRHQIGDVSQRMLTVTLRNLETDGLVKRKIYAEVPPRVEYTLSQLGYNLMVQIGQLTEWIEENSEQIIKARKKK